MLPVADGLALAAQLKGTRQVAAAFTGDGATSEGDFHEAVNLAAVWKLPVLFVIENNCYGLSTPATEQYACRDLADRGAGYGIPGQVVDGNDLLAVLAAVTAAADRARARRRADAARVQDLPHARPRGGVGHRLRAQAPLRGVGGEGPGGPVRGDAARARRPQGRRHRPAARGAQGHGRRAGGRGPDRASSGIDRRARDRRRVRPLARAEGAAAGGGRGDVDGDALRRRDPRRPAGSDEAAPAAGPHGPGHRGVRRGLQGHGRVRRGVRQGAGPQHAHHRVRRGGGRPRARPGRLPGHGRDAVRRLHHLRLQPDREQPRQDALPVGRSRSRW